MKATEHKETGEKMDIYEVSFLIIPGLSDDKLTEEVSAIQDLLRAAGASVISEEYPRLRSLAYAMEQSFEAKKRKFNEAFFGWIKFEMPVASIAQTKESLDKRSNILRHLIVKTVRENTVYSTTLAEQKAAESEAKADDMEQKEGKTVDALVIS